MGLKVSGGLGPGWPFSKVLVPEDHVPVLPVAPNLPAAMGFRIPGESLTWDPTGIPATAPHLVHLWHEAPPPHLLIFVFSCYDGPLKALLMTESPNTLKNPVLLKCFQITLFM